MAKIYLFTFCVYIDKHSKSDLLNVLNLLIKSLEKYNIFELHIFTNFEIENDKPYINIHEYFDKNENHFNNKWLNLSFNKINIYKFLYDLYNINFIWIDLDTIITTNIDYINDVDNYFIECGGTSIDPCILFKNSKKYSVPRNIWIQGNMWKLNINLYTILINQFNKITEEKLILEYDLQDLFTYYIYFILDGKLTENNIYISGRNYMPESLNGLCIWAEKGNTHANMIGLNNMYYDNNNKLQSKFYPNKEIHIVSFTFDTLKMLYNTEQFKKLFS